VLKPDGICGFGDGAVSPLWETAKPTVTPVAGLVTSEVGISPEDVLATKKGGFPLRLSEIATHGSVTGSPLKRTCERMTMRLKCCARSADKPTL
jgi:hypothetical protein